MENWCLSCRNHKILELIFKDDPPPPPYLRWRDHIQPLLEELKEKLGGDKIPEDNDEPIWVKLDSKDAIQIKQGNVIERNVYQTKIKKYLETVGVTPLPPPTGWWKRRRETLPFSRRCNHKDRGK